MNKREKAIRLLENYFSQALQRAGLRWDNDNRSEMEELADCLIGAAVQEVRAELKAKFEDIDDSFRSMSNMIGP